MNPIHASGLSVLGGFAVQPDHGVPEGIASIALLGLSEQGWGVFATSAEAKDTKPDPMDRWSKRIISHLAADMGATAFFPFGGPPYHPFLRWAAATGCIWPSPIGMSIHAQRGLWMSFRGALGFADRRDDLRTVTAERPCDSCHEKPCLRTCPVDAFQGGVYDVPTCVGHIATSEGASCLHNGCRARHACPIGTDWAPTPDQATFHMGAYLRARQAG